MAVSPAAISPGQYASGAAGSIADTTNATVASGRKVIAAVFWYGSASLSSVSGGSLTWTVHTGSQSTGTANRVCFASADAPSGLASGTTVTATFSTGGQYALGIRLASCDGLELNASGGLDTSAATAAGSTTNWSQALTTSNATDVIFGHCWVDFYTAGMAATAPATEVFDWTNADGSEAELVYTEVSSAGAQTIGGTFSGARTNTRSAVAFKLASAGTPGTFTANAGDAAAGGGSTTFTGAASFSTTVGDGAGNGGTGTFTGAGLFATATSSATADGSTATFTVTGTGTLSTTVGDATADGGTGAFTGAATFTTTAGDATGDGSTATFSIPGTFTTLVGDATADGSSATFTVTGAGTFTTSAGDATADGGTCSFTGAALFTSTAGTATAEGTTATFRTNVYTVADPERTITPRAETRRSIAWAETRRATVQAESRTTIAT